MASISHVATGLQSASNPSPPLGPWDVLTVPGLGASGRHLVRTSRCCSYKGISGWLCIIRQLVGKKESHQDSRVKRSMCGSRPGCRQLSANPAKPTAL